jgi:hypothetical protein
MANPSETNATAIGKEVIRRAYYDGVAETEQTILTGLANHIMTIISIIVCERSGQADSTFSLNIDYDNSGNDLRILTNNPIGEDGTFIWSDRFALTETDRLWMSGASTTGTFAGDVWISYIDQQFAP